jgi:hypothetical protein
MTTRLPTREQVTTILEKVRAEPEGPDQALAIERLEAQLAELDEPTSDALVGPDADLDEPLPDEDAAVPAKPAAPAPASTPPGKPAPPFGKKPDEAAKKPDNKPNSKPF